MQIGELARRANVTVQTVRFYERQGLLPEPERKESGYRVYGEKELERLLFIRQAQALGFSLNEIKVILQMRGQGECPCGEVLIMAKKHLAAVDNQIRRLTKFRNELGQAVKKWERSGLPTLSAEAFCTLIQNANTGRNQKRQAEQD